MPVPAFSFSALGPHAGENTKAIKGCNFNNEIVTTERTPNDRRDKHRNRHHSHISAYRPPRPWLTTPHKPLLL